MKKLTLALLSSTLLFASTGAFAENPASSTSGMQAEKEQLNNPDHIIDDCRAAGTDVKKEGCESGQELRKEHKSDDKMLKQGGTSDEVTQKDVQKTN
ncbi:hypothetical protein AB1E22_13855 [Buttiauxella gaviniae]|uniref:Secreted protein n=1 Tax=Buttiauxella gaviniae TaxID=82990 RepID=A0ABV3NW28_9ENTR